MDGNMASVFKEDGSSKWLQQKCQKLFHYMEYNPQNRASQMSLGNGECHSILKTLGVLWDFTTDVFTFKSQNIVESTTGMQLRGQKNLIGEACRPYNGHI